MIKFFFDQPVKKSSDNIRKIAILKEMITLLGGCLLIYNYFNNYYKMIGIGLSKQRALEADSKAMQQINFTGNLK